jgi:formylglycine-generating enzyme required for sulfatase activity
MRFSHLGVVAAVIAATASLAAAAVLAPTGGAPSGARRAAVVTLQPGWFAYRPLGDFESAGKTIDAPARATRLDAPLDVMVEPVSQAEYARCVAAAACPKLKGVDPAAPTCRSSA